MTVSLRGLGVTSSGGPGVPALRVCETYPANITFGESLECAFAPWTDTCMRVKERADLECAQYTGALPYPPALPAPGVPAEAWISAPSLSRDPQAVTDEMITAQDAKYKAQVQAFLDAQAAAIDAAAKANLKNCGLFSTWNDLAGSCLFDPSRAAFVFLAVGAVVALVAFGKR